MPMRITGMYSGLDTESIIQELVAAKQTKVDSLKKSQTALEWKQTAWKELNAKITKLYKSTTTNLAYQSSYMKKTTSVSNSNLVSVVTKDSAMDSVQSLKISKMAKAGYLTGGVITDTEGKKVSSGSKVADKLGIEPGSKFEVNVGGKATEITVDENTTISSLVSQLQSAGVKANFDAGSQRLFIGSDGTGASKDFTITATNENGVDALGKLGILTYDDKTKAAYEKYASMSTDTDAKSKAVEAKVAELLKKYTSEKTTLEKNTKSLSEKLDKLATAYNEKYPESDITDADQRAGKITTLTSDIDALKLELEDENISDERKEELTATLKEAQDELSSLKTYDENQASFKTKSDRLNALTTDYLNEDGTAGAMIQAEAESYVNGKIDDAVDLLDGFATKLAEFNNLSADKKAVKTDGQDAVIELNGATFTSSSNVFDINGLTITCKGESEEVITLTTESDVSGIYDMIKSFIKEYSSLINEMDKLYNAKSSKGYDPLTDDEKDAMSDSEVEKWESTIKDSLLRRDSTLSSVSSAMKTIMASGFAVNGKTMYLSDFGIETLGYFNAADNEKNAYHINGDEDEDTLKNKTNTLKEMITSDPNAVIDFFTQLAKSMNSKMKDLTASNQFSSIDSVYDDKKMKDDYKAYTTKITAAEAKLKAYEDKWYKKFSAMETAMAKMQSNSSAITGLLGGS